ncbi:VOC family protein [Pseudaestuariivita sp.]|uniref:VOC family protein n=1 Tax=Pseudaestuariivita sp. TaxID=2211669 RepID=UPI0040592A4D
MERVSGIGGIFVRADDSSALAAWYRDTLGVDPVPQGPGDMPWMQEAGATIFAPFPSDTDYFRKDRRVMLNFRVTDLDRMIAQVRAGGTEVKVLDDMPGIGRFAHIEDPEGNPIELWEPVAG